MGGSNRFWVLRIFLIDSVYEEFECFRIGLIFDIGWEYGFEFDFDIGRELRR